MPYGSVESEATLPPGTPVQVCPRARPLRPDHFDLGSGKLVLAKDGRLVNRSEITVPAAMHGQRRPRIPASSASGS